MLKTSTAVSGFVCPNCNTEFKGKDIGDCPICFMARGSTERVISTNAPGEASLHWVEGSLLGKNGEVIPTY